MVINLKAIAPKYRQVNAKKGQIKMLTGPIKEIQLTMSPDLPPDLVITGLAAVEWGTKLGLSLEHGPPINKMRGNCSQGPSHFGGCLER